MRREFLLIDEGRAVIANPDRLPRKHGDRVSIEGNHNIGIAMQDVESAHVADRAFEPGVFATTDDQVIEPAILHDAAYICVAALDLGFAGSILVNMHAHNMAHSGSVQEYSRPLIIRAMASLSGVGTPTSLPILAMPPFSASTSVARLANMSCSMLGLCL